METDVKSLNKFLAGFELERAEVSPVTGGFSVMATSTASTSSGVAVFMVSATTAYQNIKKTERKKMTMGGEDVVEKCLNACYLTILHGITFRSSPFRTGTIWYAIGGYKRAIVKAWITATIVINFIAVKATPRIKIEFQDAGIDKPFGLASLNH